MTQIRNPPAGPLVGDVEADLVSHGIWFGKAAYHFAEPHLSAAVDARAGEIARLDPSFGVLDRDGTPMLTAKRARSFVQDYDNEAFRGALCLYAAALDECLIDLTSRILHGQLAICHESEAGETWTWVPARKYRRLHPDEEDPTMAHGDGGPFTGVLAFDVAEVVTWLAKQSSKTVPTIEGKPASNPPASSAQRGHLLLKKKTGPKGNMTGNAAAAMLEDIKMGRRTVDDLKALKQDSLKSLYGVGSRDTATKALAIVVSEFNSGK